MTTSGDASTPELADLVAGAPRMGLRERKKAAAMRRLQEVAVEQFEEHGFDAVTIEHIAAHAEVSPSTVYRYFGTKEALVLRDEFDDQILALAPVLLAEHDVYTAFEKAIELIAAQHLAIPMEMAWRRTKIWMETPSIRGAGFLMAEEMAHALTPLVVASPVNDLDHDAAHIVCTAAVMAIFAAIENWYRSERQADMLTLAADAVRLVKPAWAAKGSDQ
ncbi:TetR/AcrR family transcriptional regulator [Blastococcus sp. Marseille-P5729]|uniref:TetR/AcrR family transcriptional regulator n=1 Tax=Blastococcus sp. Marseille-P5729 TaxID=2086582 RepID=UPI0018FE5A16|nr:TetR/AcrR family transcriptional regulator [Blastococcus sp. Marseille-P5729]